MQLIPYLMFSGQCREAFAFYAKVLGGQVVTTMTYGESPMCDQMPPETRDWVMHSQIDAPGTNLMGADGAQVEVADGGGTMINVQVETSEEAERVFAALLEGGNATLPIQETFWAHRFGMLVDRYGKPWMVNSLKPMPA